MVCPKKKEETLMKEHKEEQSQINKFFKANFGFQRRFDNQDDQEMPEGINIKVAF